MSMFGFFRRKPQDNTADTAKERLSILLAHERTGRAGPDVLPIIQREIIEVIQRHMKVARDSGDGAGSPAGPGNALAASPWRSWPLASCPRPRLAVGRCARSGRVHLP